MKLAPENYGCDVVAQYTKEVSVEKWKGYENELKERDEQGLEPKYKLNKALERWWKRGLWTLSKTTSRRHNTNYNSVDKHTIFNRAFLIIT